MSNFAAGLQKIIALNGQYAPSRSPIVDSIIQSVEDELIPPSKRELKVARMEAWYGVPNMSLQAELELRC